MRNLVLALYYARGTGWNYAIIANGQPLPADDPVDADNVDGAYRAALASLNRELDAAETSVRQEADR
jgi:hypothetical protein